MEVKKTHRKKRPPLGGVTMEVKKSQRAGEPAS